MLTFAKRTGAALLVAVVLLILTASPVQAQGLGAPRVQPPIQPINPNPFIAPGLRLNQWRHNTTAIGNTLNQYPAYLLYGFNPYVQNLRVAPGAFAPSYPSGFSPSYAPSMPYGGYNPGMYSGGYNFPAANPGYSAPTYGGGYGPGMYSGYSGGYSSGYSGGYGYDPYGYGYDPYGGYLRATASAMQAYGQLGLAQEQAAFLREVANQAKIETRKKMIDLRNYERLNTPTSLDRQKMLDKLVLDRLQYNATLGEIWSGKAQDKLADALTKKALLKVPTVHQVNLNDKLMGHINVATKGTYGNIGLLRNEGKFEWPVALQEIADEKEQKNIADDARRAYNRAAANQSLATAIDDLTRDVDSLRERLLKKANDIPTTQYLAAKRFLNDFDAALLALKNGDVKKNLDFHKEFAGKDKTVQDLIVYMATNGLRFAPAVPGDEDAYQSLYTMIAAYRQAVETQLVGTKGY